MKITKNIREIDTERMLWSGIPREYQGRKLHCLDELRDLFPENEHYRKVQVRKTEMGRNIYVREYRGGKRTGKNLLDHYVAYDCPHCNRIIVGPPEIKEDDMTRTASEHCTYCDYRIKRLAA